MSLADELLDSLTENQTDSDLIEDSNEPHIVITSDKDIIVPDILREIAVQHEHNVKTVTFDCPRYWDGRDLLNMVIYINYERKDGEKGRYPVTNLRVDEADSGMIHFDWTVTRHATDAFGELTILACGMLVNNEGVEEQHWNSHRNEDMEVAEGLECADAIADAYPDEITVILGQLSDLKRYLEENMPKKVSDLENDADYMSAETFAESMKGYYTSDQVDQKLQNLDKYATTEYVDGLVGDINSILATLSNGGVE